MAEDSLTKNKRIAKNTLVLYLRTILTMFVSLYTSRLILQVLGVDNFGIVNVVGGLVGMFSLISGSISGAVGRFLTFCLGTGDKQALKTMFATSINVLIAFSVIVVVVGEPVGLYLLTHKLQIPAGSMHAAHWVFQCTLVQFVLGLVTIPYNSMIVAHERMGVFAVMSILEVTLKLLFVLALFITPFDRLITYTVLTTVISLIVRVIYGVYCKRHFEECRYEFVLDKAQTREMFSFAGWNFFGSTAWLFNTQGVNILINMYFGVALNAARGVVGQVEGAVMTFVGNFTTALNPQITKSYAEGDTEYLYSLICRGTKIAVYLMLFFMIPLEFQVETVLGIWLTDVPEYSAPFLRLALVCSFILAFGNTQYTAIMATGNIRSYQIVITLVGCLVFPLTWLVFKLGCSPVSAYFTFISVYFVLVLIRLWYLKQLTGFPLRMMLTLVVAPSLRVLALSLIVPAALYLWMAPGWGCLILTVVASVATTSTAIFLVGLTPSEKSFVLNKIRRIIGTRLHIKQCQ